MGSKTKTAKRYNQGKVTSDPENQDNDHEDNPQKHLSKLTDCEEKSNNMGRNWLNRKKGWESYKKGKGARMFQDPSDTEHEEESVSEKTK